MSEAVLVAGGAGYIGSHVTKLLARRGYHPVILDNLVYGHRWAAKWGTFVEADLGRPPLPLKVPVDAILSTATFHWVLDHDALLRGLAGTLRPGGQLSFQCGGEGNATALIQAARDEGVETAGRFHMAGVAETLTRLAASGFVEARAWLEPRTIEFASRGDLVDYIVTPYLRPATGLPESPTCTTDRPSRSPTGFRRSRRARCSPGR